MSENAKIDQNRNKALLGVTDDLNKKLVNFRVDPATRRLKVSATISNTGFIGVWDSTKTYELNNFVNYNEVIYVSLQATNLNNIPGSSPTWWSTYAAILDTDGTLSANSDSRVASQKATKTYVDTSISNIPSPMRFIGAIAVASDFPTVAAVKTGWTYRITANVTDNDPTKTNTGLSFLAGDEISWNDAGTWSNLGSAALWTRTGINLQPATAGDDIGETGTRIHKIWATSLQTTNSPIIDSLTPSGILASDASKNIITLPVATYPSLTELSYVKGVTSAIQTQLNGKQATLNTGSVTVDFGQGPSFEVITTVSNVNALTGSQIYCTLVPTANATHEVDEYDIDGLQCYAQNIVNATSFDLVVSCNELLGGVHGQYVINYIIK